MEHLRTLRPADGVFAFYDGRIEGYRFAEQPNWVDEGALSLGIASYAIVDRREALIYDTHVSVERARFIRDALEERGIEKFTVVLSHWHLDHIAGTAAFADCEVIASERTAELMRRNRSAIESGSLEGAPPIDPLIMPTSVYSDHHELEIGRRRVHLIQVEIHSDDATVLWLADQRLLLCGDTMEDTVTYVDEPERFDAHLRDLEALGRMQPARILPSHGAPDVIAAGGYSIGLLRATQQYIETLRRCVYEPDLREAGLEEVIAGPLAARWVRHYEPYEAVHRENVAKVLAASKPSRWRLGGRRRFPGPSSL